MSKLPTGAAKVEAKAPAAKKYDKPGKPSPYDKKEIMREICIKLVEGMSLRAICKQEGMPNMESITICYGIYDNK